MFFVLRLLWKYMCIENQPFSLTLSLIHLSLNVSFVAQVQSWTTAWTCTSIYGCDRKTAGMWQIQWCQGISPPPLFSVLVSRQDLFYLNYNEGKRVSETGLWQIMKWRQKGELNLEHVQKSQANIMCCALHHRWQQTNINNKIKRSCKQQQPTNK